MGDYQARFCERLKGKFLRPTRRLNVMVPDRYSIYLNFDLFDCNFKVTFGYYLRIFWRKLSPGLKSKIRFTEKKEQRDVITLSGKQKSLVLNLNTTILLYIYNKYVAI